MPLVKVGPCRGEGDDFLGPGLVWPCRERDMARSPTIRTSSGTSRASATPRSVAAFPKVASGSSDRTLGSQRASGSTRDAMTINTAETAGRTERVTTFADRAQLLL
jgi:hypothetical protein